MAAFYHNKQCHPHRPPPPQENPPRWVTLVALVALVARAKSPYYTGPLLHRRGRGLQSPRLRRPYKERARGPLYLILEDLILEVLFLEDLIREPYKLAPNSCICLLTYACYAYTIRQE